MKTKVIFFDAGGTLFRPCPSVGAVYARVAAKPGKGIFEAVLKSMNADAAHSLHVGDSLEDDYHGASRAGLKAVLLNRHNKPYNDVTHVASLTDLIPLLK